MRKGRMKEVKAKKKRPILQWILTVWFILSMFSFVSCSDSDVESMNDSIASAESEALGTTEIVENAEVTYTGDPYFEIHYIDVGQGDSALVLCDGDAMLIDGGTSSNSDLIYTYLKQMEVHKLDYMVASHPHDDHVGGLAGALNFAVVENVLCSTTSYDSEAFGDFVKYAEKQGLAIEVPEVGDSFKVGSSSVEILGVNASSEANNSSIVMKVTYGNTSFLFTGDAVGDTEETLLNAGCDLNSTVLKIGHHGSSLGTTEAFLNAVDPAYAIISVGEDNVYDHPTADTLTKLKESEITTYRTDMQGDIVCKSDGENITVIVEKNAGADTLEIPVVVVATPEPTPAPTETPEPTIAPTEAPALQPTATPKANVRTYVLNTNTKKFHYESCKSVKQMSEKNKAFYTGTREECMGKGYDPCGNCKP